MMKNRFAIILLLCPFGLAAQRVLPSDTFRVVKNYQPILIDAEKIRQEAVIDDTLELESDLEYKLIDKDLPVHFQPGPIEAARIKGEPLMRLYNGYARVGVGNALTPFAEVYYNNLRSRKYAAGGHLKFINQPEVNQLEGSEFMQLDGQFYGKRFWKRNTLSTELNYGLRQFNYYGYYNIPKLSTNELAAGDLEQQYNRLSISTELASTKQDSFNLRHQVSLDYNMISNGSQMQEHYLRAKGKLSQFNNSELYQLDMALDYNSYDDLSESSILYLKPSITSIGTRFRIKAGLGVYMNASQDDNASFHFYPLAEVSYNVLEDVLIPYAGAKGEIRRNNYFHFTEENPFLAENQLLANSNERYNLYLGLRGAFSKRLTFNVMGSRVETEASPFYLKVPDADLLISHQFYINYDDLTENRIKGELSYHSEKVKVFLNASYFDFETNELERAWHRPELTASLSGQYNLYDKLIAGIDLVYWGEQYAPQYEIRSGSNPIQLNETVETLEAIFDVNLSFEYRYTKRLSAFIKFNNLGGLNYEKYQDYPLQGFNTWGGLTYSF